MCRSIVVAGLLLLTAVAVVAQEEYPKVETAPGFMFIRSNPNFTNSFTVNGKQITGSNDFNCAGGGGTLAYNISSVFGLAADLGGCKFFGNPTGLNTNKITGNQFTYLFGPRLTLRGHGPLEPFFDLGFGGDRLGASCNSSNGNCITRFGTGSYSWNAFALSVGGGINIKLSRKFALRPFQGEYLYTRFGNSCAAAVCNNNNNQNSFRLKSGLVIGWGGATPPPPTAACSATPSELLAWAGPVNASLQTANFNPKHTLNYNWNSTSGPMGAQGTSASIDTTNLTPGNYTITARATDPKEKKSNVASCTASFTVKQPQSPSIACSATPSSVQPGQPITINVQGSSPDGSRIEKRTFNASAGAIKEGETTAGSQPGEFTTVATLDTTNAPPGALNVSIGVTDVHGYSGSCVATANVIAPPPPVEVVSETLISECDFKNERKRARVDNECKAILDEVALRLQHEPNGKLVVVGYAEEQEEVVVSDVESLRAANAKAYLTGGEAKQQIDPSRIEVRKSSARDNGSKAKFYFVPEGGTFTVKDTTIVDESSLPADRTGAPTKHKASQQPAAPSGQ